MYRSVLGNITYALMPIFFLASGPASAENFLETRQAPSSGLKWEMTFLGLSAVDAAQPMSCLHANKCTEGNPLFGKHPTSAKLLLGKAVLGAVHFALFTRLNDQNPTAALRLAQISAITQGGVVALNARVTFK